MPSSPGNESEEDGGEGAGANRIAIEKNGERPIALAGKAGEIMVGDYHGRDDGELGDTKKDGKCPLASRSGVARVLNRSEDKGEEAADRGEPTEENRCRAAGFSQGSAFGGGGNSAGLGRHDRNGGQSGDNLERKLLAQARCE